MMACIFTELSWNMLMAIPTFFTWYYPIGLYHNADSTDGMVARGGIMFTFILTFMMFTSSFSSMMIAGIDQAETGANMAQLLYSFCLVFNG
jgi:ABC-type multidrug transport system permease subunit